MDAIKNEARIAGLGYLVIAIVAPFSLAYVPGEVAAIPGSIADKIRATHDLLIMSVSTVLFYQSLEAFITLALYNMFKGFDNNTARIMLVLGLLPLPIAMLNEVTVLGAIDLANSTPDLAGVDSIVRDGMAALLYNLHFQGLGIAGIFWGLWLLPLGSLIFRSGPMPKWLGVSVIIGGLGYVLRTITYITLPVFLPPAATDICGMIANIMTLGEVPVILGLLWVGFGPKRQANAT